MASENSGNSTARTLARKLPQAPSGLPAGAGDRPDADAHGAQSAGDDADLGFRRVCLAELALEIDILEQAEREDGPDVLRIGQTDLEPVVLADLIRKQLGGWSGSEGLVEIEKSAN